MGRDRNAFEAGRKVFNKGLRRRIMSALRRATRVLGMNRDNLALGINLGAGSGVVPAVAAGSASTKSSGICCGLTAVGMVLAGLSAPAQADVVIDGFMSVISPTGISCARPGSTGPWTCQIPKGNGGFATLGNITGATGADAVAYASSWASSNLGQNSIAFGFGDLQASGDNAIAIGNDASAEPERSIAIGYGAWVANDPDSIAIGTNSEVYVESSIALGNEAKTRNDYSGTIGTNSVVNGTQSYAIGNDNQLGAFYYSGLSDAFVLGNRVSLSAEYDDPLVHGAVALGSDTRVTVPGGVALGRYAVASTAEGVAGYVPPGATAAQAAAITATTGTLAAVSVGDAANGQYRQITGVAAGAADSDAVNVAQLRAVSSSAAAGAVHYYSVNDNGVVGGNYDNDGATGPNSLAAGVSAKAAGIGSIAMGYEANAYAGGVSIGYGAGKNSTPTATNQQANVWIGDNAGANSSGSNNLAIGTANSGTVVLGNSNTAVGQTAGTRVTGDSNTALGGSAGGNVYGFSNTALGSMAGQFVGSAAINSSRNTAVGLQSGAYVNGDSNVAMGDTSGWGTKGSRNVAIGRWAGNGAVYEGGFPDETKGTVTNRTIAIGDSAWTYASQAVAIGYGAKSKAVNAIAIGTGAQATGVSSISIGTGNVVTGDRSGAIGDPTTINGSGTYSLGNDNGTIDANNSGVVGNDNTITGALEGVRVVGNSNTVSAGGAMVLGNNATVSEADGVALGSDTTVSHAGSVALGANSVADGSTLGNDAYSPTGDLADIEGTAPVGEVSVGSSGNERRVTNVAAGAEDTDAVNVSQLKAAQDEATTHYYDVNSTATGTGSNYDNDGALGANSMAAGANASTTAAASNGTAIGTSSLASASGATALGYSSLASGANSISLGDSTAAAADSIAAGRGANVAAAAANGTAIGYNTSVTGARGVAIGTQVSAAVTTAGSQSVGIGAGARATGTNAIALGTYSLAGNNSVALGSNADATQVGTIAIGETAYAGVDAIHIGHSTVTGNRSGHTGAFRRGTTLIGDNANSQGLYSTVIGNSNNLLVNQNIQATGLLGAQFVAQGAFSNITGAYNTVGTRGTSATDTTTNNKTFSGVAVTVTGSANNVQDSNGALVAGYGNTITNSYDDQINVSGIHESINPNAISDLIRNNDTKLGQVGVIGAGNTLDNGNNVLVTGMHSNVSNAKMSSVQGFENEASDIENVSIAGAGNKVTGATDSFIAGNDNTINDVSNVMAVGSGQELDGTSQSVLLGDRIAFDGTQAVAIGDDTKVADQAVAVGVTAQALGEKSIAIGYDAIATGSVATGASARAGNGGAAFGDGAVATYLGGATTAGTVAGAALGQNASADVSGAVALGTGATVTAENSVALGAGSVADGATLGDSPYQPLDANGDPIPVAGTSPVGEVSVGTAGSERRITNVAAGSADTDAVNVSQLAATAAAATSKVAAGTNVNDVAQTVNADGSTTYTVNADGATASAGSSYVTVAAGAKDANNVTDYEVDVAQNVKDAVDAVENDGLTFTGDSGTTGTKKLGDTVAVNGDDNITTTADADGVKVALNQDLNVTSVTTGNTMINNDGLTIIGGPSITNVGINAGGTTITNVAAGVNNTDAVNVSQLTEAAAAATSKVEAGTNVNDVAQTVNADGSTTYTVNADGTSASAGSSYVTVAAGTKDANNVTDYEVDVAQNVKDAVDAVENDGLTFTGDSGTTGTKKLGDTVAVNGDDNITTTADADGVKVALNPNLNVTSVTTGNTMINNDGLTIIGGPSITNVGINAGGTTITNVAAGVNDTDAVNVSQLNDVSTAANAGWNVSAQGANSTNVGPESTTGTDVDLNNADGNIVVSKAADSNDVTFDLANDLTVNNSITVNGGTTITGDTVTTTNVNTTNLTAGDNFYVDNSGAHYDGPITEGDHVVNKNYVDNSVTELADTPLAFAGDTGTNVERKLGETLNVKGGATGNLTEGNIGVDADGSDTLNIKLAENVDLGSSGSVTTGNTVINNDGLTINGGPSVTTGGINVNNTKITNVAAGTDATDAVNVSQLNDAAAAATTKVAAGTNVNDVAESTNADGSKTYTVNANGTTASAGSTAVTVTAGAKDANNVTDYQVDLAQQTKDDIAQGVEANDTVNN
ncbi:Head domain of trimeric autotransporter adhesin, partial [Methylobacillus rhizosphaerae]